MESVHIANETAAPSAIAFIKHVADLYHRNIWLFWKILLPAAAFGYFVLFLSLDRYYDIYKRLPHGPDLLYHKAEILEASLFRFGGYAADWVIYCFAFAAISIAVDELEAGKHPSVEACFTGARDRLFRFFGLSLSLFGVCVTAIVLWEVLFILFLFSFGPNRMLKNPLFSLGIFFVPIWAVSRFGLAIPTFVLEKSSIAKAFSRSGKLTESCWTILAILLLESVGGSYLVYLLIKWLTWQAAHHGIAPSWIANLGLPLGLLIGFVLEPHMFIGFALLYVRRSLQPVSTSASAVSASRTLA